MRRVAAKQTMHLSYSYFRRCKPRQPAPATPTITASRQATGKGPPEPAPSDGHAAIHSRSGDEATHQWGCDEGVLAGQRCLYADQNIFIPGRAFTPATVDAPVALTISTQTTADLLVPATGRCS